MSQTRAELCPTPEAISSKITSVLASLRGESANTNANCAPHITSPASEGFAQTIDHTLLKPDATQEQIDKLCEEARKFRFKSVCVNPLWASRATSQLSGSGVSTCCVVNFPLGSSLSEAVCIETKAAINHGAIEIDTVLPIGLLKSNPPQYTTLYCHLTGIIAAAAPHPVKVIIETALLTEEEKVAACYIAAEAGAAFVKTCTGFSGGGATVEDVRLMKKAVEHKGGRVRVKASGGVRTFEKCLEVLRAGADRIGTSSGVGIMEGEKPKGESY